MLLKNTPHFESIVFSTLFLVCRNVVKGASRRVEKVQYQSDKNQQVRYQDKESLCEYKCCWCNELEMLKLMI